MRREGVDCRTATDDHLSRASASASTLRKLLAQERALARLAAAVDRQIAPIIPLEQENAALRPVASEQQVVLTGWQEQSTRLRQGVAAVLEAPIGLIRTPCEAVSVRIRCAGCPAGCPYTTRSAWIVSRSRRASARTTARSP